MSSQLSCRNHPTLWTYSIVRAVLTVVQIPKYIQVPAPGWSMLMHTSDFLACWSILQSKISVIKRLQASFSTKLDPQRRQNYLSLISTILISLAPQKKSIFWWLLLRFKHWFRCYFRWHQNYMSTSISAQLFFKLRQLFDYDLILFKYFHTKFN